MGPSCGSHCMRIGPGVVRRNPGAALAVDGRRVDPEQACGLGDVAIGNCDGSFDRVALDLRKRTDALARPRLRSGGMVWYAGRAAASIAALRAGPSFITTARRIVFSSSRTLPGHVSPTRRPSASGVNPSKLLPSSVAMQARRWRAIVTTSFPRSRNAGMRIGMTWRR